MKFRLPILFVLAFTGIVAMSSCVKKYTCHCVIKYSGYPGLPDSSIQEYDITDSKSGAKSKCEGESIDKTTNGVRTVETCTLY